MTAEELIIKLKKHPQAQVKVIFDGIARNITADNVYLSKDGVLLIDAENNAYRDEFEKGGLSAKSDH